MTNEPDAGEKANIYEVRANEQTSCQAVRRQRSDLVSVTNVNLVQTVEAGAARGLGERQNGNQGLDITAREW